MSLVWSDDPKDKCPSCGKLKGQNKDQCRCEVEKKPFQDSKFVAVFRMEKNGRGGKTVTVIDNLPKQEVFLQTLTKELKNRCGTGGTYRMDGKEGIIEIQGDKRAQIKAIFETKGIKFKGQ